MIAFDILHFLYRRWVAILLCTLVTTAAGIVAINYLMQPEYRAEAQVLLQIGREHVVDTNVSAGGDIRPVLRFEQDEQISLATEMLTSHLLTERLVAALGFAQLFPQVSAAEIQESEKKGESAIQLGGRLLREQLEVEQVGHSPLLSISIMHESAPVGAQAVNSLVQLFLDRHIELTSQSTHNNFYARRLQEIETSLQTDERALTNFKRQHNVHNSVIDDKADLLTRATNLRSELEQSVVEVQELSTRLKVRKRQQNKNRLAELSARQASEIRQDLLLNEAALSGTRARLAAQETQLQDILERTGQLDDLESDYSRLLQRVHLGKANQELYLQKHEAANVSEEMNRQGLASVLVVEAAAVPARTEPSKKRLVAILAAIFGLLVGVCAAFVADMLAPTFSSGVEIERQLQIPVIASIPRSQS